jgi:DNA-directed RNA polymerase alpha subunit
MDMEFDLIGLDASIANAFRRILISEVWVDNTDYFAIERQWRTDLFGDQF